jgi:hypothetical protein
MVPTVIERAAWCNVENRRSHPLTKRGIRRPPKEDRRVEKVHPRGHTSGHLSRSHLISHTSFGNQTTSGQRTNREVHQSSAGRSKSHFHQTDAKCQPREDSVAHRAHLVNVKSAQYSIGRHPARESSNGTNKKPALTKRNRRGVGHRHGRQAFRVAPFTRDASSPVCHSRAHFLLPRATRYRGAAPLVPIRLIWFVKLTALTFSTVTKVPFDSPRDRQRRDTAKRRLFTKVTDQCIRCIQLNRPTIYP